MNNGILLLGLLAFGLTGPALASSAREMGQSELRQVANSGKTVSLKATLNSVSKSLQASVLDARAYDAGGIYYRLVLKRTNGELVSVIINAQNGRHVAPSSIVGQDVTAAAMKNHTQVTHQATLTDFSTRTP